MIHYRMHQFKQLIIPATLNVCLSLQLRSSGRRQLIKPPSDLQKRLMGCPLHLLLIELELAVESPVQCATYSNAEFLLLSATQSLKIHFYNDFFFHDLYSEGHNCNFILESYSSSNFWRESGARALR